jgi:hypothetical protein
VLALREADHHEKRRPRASTSEGRTRMSAPQTQDASPIDAIVAPFEAAAKIATAIDTVATALDGARTVVLILENTTYHQLERVSESHSHGGFDVTPTAVIPARSTAVWSSKDKGFMTGTEGQVTYRVEDRADEETLFQVSWNNPFVGNNKAAAVAYYNGTPVPPPVPQIWIRSEHYEGLSVCGAGDKEAEMRYTLKRL